MNEISYTNVPSAQKVQTRTFSTVETVFSWLSLLVGYAFCRAFPVTSNTLGGFLFVVGIFAATFIALKVKGVKFKVLQIVAAVSAVTISASLILCSSSFLCSLSYLYAIATYCYFVYSSCGNSLKNGFNNLIFIDYFKALFVLPFESFEQIFKALLSGKAKGKGKVLLKLLLGVAIAIIPTVVVLLLLSYDSAFSDIINRILDFDLSNIFSHIGSFILGVPIGMYIFGLFISSVDNKGKEIITAEKCEKASEKMKVAPTVTTLAAVIPLLVVYVIFFISQWQYYISGFTGVLPESFSYAEYAREGFFQLCAVSVINLLVIISVVLLMSRGKKYHTEILKVLSVIYSVFTLILISTAIAKMVMYIDCYGLTQKRVYATWFMVVLAVVFVIIMVRQFVPKLNAIALSLALCVALFGVLSLSNVDGFIAKYNADCYIAGSLETVDVYAMGRLGDAAVPELVRLAEMLADKQDKSYAEIALEIEIKTELEDYETENNSFFSFNLPSYRAEQAIEKCDNK